MDDAGSAVPLSEEMRAKLEETVTTMASSGLRTLCLTLRDMDEGMAEGNAEFWENPPDEQLTLCCIVGIKVKAQHIHSCLQRYPPLPWPQPWRLMARAQCRTLPA